jgi:hypothetical protein
MRNPKLLNENQSEIETTTNPDNGTFPEVIITVNIPSLLRKGSLACVENFMHGTQIIRGGGMNK